MLVGLLALVYAVCYAAIKAGLAFAPLRRLWPWIFALAVTGTLVAYTGMFLSPRRAGAGIASVLGNTGPLMIVALATQHNCPHYRLALR